MILVLILLAILGLIAAWHLFEWLWDRRQFGDVADGTFVENIRAGKALRLVAETADLVVVDVRPRPGFLAGHVPGAVNAPFVGETLESGGLASVPRDRPLLVYCDGGYRSRRALGALRAEGFRGIHHLHRGFMSWKAAGGSVEGGA